MSLISSGTSGQQSGFLDASENGNDVFFLTSEQLVAADKDNAYDVYDAHVCGAEGIPCTTSPTETPECKEAESCRGSAEPQPSIFGPPASATFSGPGNLTPEPPAKPKPPTAAELRAKHLAAALATCRRKYKHSKHRRTSCEKQARKSYGARTGAHKSKR